MIVAILGLTVAFNLIIILAKFQKKDYINGLIDSSLLILVAFLFSGSATALSMGTIGSLVVSLYLIKYPFSAGGSYAKY